MAQESWAEDREREAIGPMLEWFDAVYDQLASGQADFAQVDIDTVVPDADVSLERLVEISITSFRALCHSEKLVRTDWELQLTVPVFPELNPKQPQPDQQLDSVLARLRVPKQRAGVPVPGFLLTTWQLPERNAPWLASQGRIRLSWNETPGTLVHYRSEICKERKETWEERALEFRRCTAPQAHLEARFPIA